MKQPLFTSGVPIDEKRLSRLERIVLRLTRRASRQVKTVTAPYPISGFASGTGVLGEILGYLFCADGNISKGRVSLGEKPKKPVEVSIGIIRDTGTIGHVLVVSKKDTSIKLNYDVLDGDKLSVSIIPQDPEEIITRVWLAFMWTPKIKEASIKSFLIDDLDGGFNDPDEE